MEFIYDQPMMRNIYFSRSKEGVKAGGQRASSRDKLILIKKLFYFPGFQFYKAM